MLSRFYYFFKLLHLAFFIFVYIHFTDIRVWKKVKVAHLCPILGNPMDYTVHGILQARILEWLLFPSPGESSQPEIKPRSHTMQVNYWWDESQGKPKELTRDSCIAGRVFTNWAMREAQSMEEAKINVCCIQYFLYAQKSSNCYPIRREYPTVCAPVDCNLPGSCPWDSPGKRRSRLPCHPQEGCPNPGIKSPSPVSPALQADSLPAECRFFSIHFFKLIYFLLKDNCFTEFCCFLSNLNMNQP